MSHTAETYKFGTVHGIHYTVGQRMYNFVVVVSRDGSADIVHATVISDVTPDELHAARVTLLQTEAHLEGRCGLGSVMDEAKERCTEKTCAHVA
jgi:hypothetical protein